LRRANLEVGYTPFADKGWIITYKDISARVNVEKELASHNERFNAALTNIPHGVCMFDAEKRLILCNDRYQRLYNLPAELTHPGTPLQAILDYRAATRCAPVEMSTYFDVVMRRTRGSRAQPEDRPAGRPHDSDRPQPHERRLCRDA